MILNSRNILIINTKLITIFSLLLIIGNCFSQTITWQRTYDGADHVSDGGFDVCKADADNIYVCGYTTVLPNFKRVYVLKLNPYGDTIWTRTVFIGITVAGGDSRAITESGDGGCVVSGSAQYAYSIKFNSNGDIIWNKNYGGNFRQCFSIIKTSDGGYIACGRNAEGINQGAYLLKFDSIGNLQWQKTYYAGYWKNFYSVAEAHNKDGFFLAGFRFNYSQDTLKSIILRINSVGDSLWEKEYDKSTVGIIYNIKRINTGYLIAGNNFPTQTSQKNFIGRIEENGDTAYIKSIESTNLNEYFGKIDVINPNKYVIAASRDSIVAYNAHVLIVDSTGDVLADKIYQSGDFIDLKSVIPLSNGDIVFTGQVDFDPINTKEDIYVLRTDSLLNAPPPISVNYTNILLPTKLKVYQNYPNPFNPSTVLKYELKKNSFIRIDLFDITGKFISLLEAGNKNAGEYNYFLEMNQLHISSGIYFVKFQIFNELTQIIRIAYIK